MQGCDTLRKNVAELWKWKIWIIFAWENSGNACPSLAANILTYSATAKPIAMKNLIVRSISGIVYVALIVGAIFAGFNYFGCLMGLFALLGVLEFQRLVTPPGQMAVRKIAHVLDALTAVWMAVSFLLDLDVMIISLLYIPVYMAVRFTLALYDKGPTPFRAAALSVMSLAYIATGLTAATAAYMVAVEGFDFRVILVMFMMIWLNDTGAYCFGSILGRHRLFERLSPKKSWEGFFGGLLCSVLTGTGAYIFLPQAQLPLWAWLVTGLLVTVFATWGDLFESLLKRNLGVKDSGNLIPGHGGILDRIDSLLFVAPMVMLVLVLLSF